MQIHLYYDKQCPFCNNYATFLNLKSKYHLKLFNAREHIKKINEFKKNGFDINDGFIVEINKTHIYQGADGIIFLNKIAENKIFFYDNFLFRKILYPLLKQFRKILLFIKKIPIKI